MRRARLSRMNLRWVRVASWAVLVVLCMALPGHLPAPGFAQDAPAPVTITVTSSGDSVLEGEAVCPSETLCTLRRAIELANAGGVVEEDSDTVENSDTEESDTTEASDTEEEPQSEGPIITITFDPAVFPPEAPVTIAVSGSPLPAIEQPNTHIDGSGAGVIIDGSLLEEDDQPGLRFAAGVQSVRGIAVQHFTGTCVDSSGDGFVAGGDPAEGHGLRIGDCTTGIMLAGDDARVHSVALGDGADLAVETAIHVTGSNAVIGAGDEEQPWPNAIGQANTGIRVGGGAVVTDGTRIFGNSFGAPLGEDSASVTYGVVIQAPANGSIVRNNGFAHVLEAAVAIGAPAGQLPNSGHAIGGNAYGAVGMAIDLNANGTRDPNDPNDSDGGANGTRNHPIFTKVTIAGVRGTAGVTCAGCLVEIYRANHAPGGIDDLPTNPISITVTDSDGVFEANVPGLSEGEWLIATVTDEVGNTSEFGPPERVGSGLVQCGATQLVDGWNHAGFFGAQRHGPRRPIPSGGPGSRAGARGVQTGRWLKRVPPLGCRDAIRQHAPDARTRRVLLLPGGRRSLAAGRVRADRSLSGEPAGGLERLRLYRRRGPLPRRIRSGECGRTEHVPVRRQRRDFALGTDRAAGDPRLGTRLHGCRLLRDVRSIRDRPGDALPAAAMNANHPRIRYALRSRR